MVEQQQEQRANPEAGDGGHEREIAEVCAFLHRWNQQAPDGRCDHDAGREAHEHLLNVHGELMLHEEHAGRTERRAEERDGQPFEDDGRKDFVHEKTSLSNGF